MVVATVDVIIENGNKIVLVRRLAKPFKGKLALPGGHVNHNELVENAALREAKEETGLKVKLIDVLGVYSDPKRDSRGHYVATVFIAKIISGILKGGTDAKVPAFYDSRKLKEKDIAFDHFKMIKDYLKYKKKKRTYWSTR